MQTDEDDASDADGNADENVTVVVVERLVVEVRQDETQAVADTGNNEVTKICSCWQ